MAFIVYPIVRDATCLDTQFFAVPSSRRLIRTTSSIQAIFWDSGKLGAMSDDAPHKADAILRRLLLNRYWKR
jgi:hypothetical protein